MKTYPIAKIALGLSAAVLALALAAPATAGPGDRGSESEAAPAPGVDAKGSGAEGPSQTADHISDLKFLNEAALDSMAEVRLAEMAREKSDDPAVKDLATILEQDHEETRAELVKLARERDLELPERLDPESQSLIQRLGALDGSEFDRAYTDAMVEQHVEAIAMFREASRSGHGDVEAYAQRIVPILEQHLELAREANQDVSAVAAERSARR